jgi:alpha-L-fucosidase
MAEESPLKIGEYKIEAGPFKPTWESLQKYECPNWFKDAKFGIWAHWGPQAVPQAGDWYARNMYMEGSEQYKYHLEHYGHPSKFGYKDILPLWKAENFDPESLIKLYIKTGAKYFTVLGVHHDNFDCWDSLYNKWNSVNIGPKKDIVGMWRQAASKEGIRFGLTEHLERSYSWFNTNKGKDSEGPYAGIPYDGNNPEYADFYHQQHDDMNRAYPKNPPEWIKWQWYARVKDLLEKYHPDLLYTDGGIPFGEIGLAMIANFYNNNIKLNNGALEAVYNLKDRREDDRRESLSRGEYMDGVGVQDVERGVTTEISPEPWQTDTCIGDWYYRKNMKYKTAETVIHMLADIVSKNGNLLLNFPLKPDGSLDDECERVAKDIGDWMAVNSEAIYGTRPWRKFGEGLTRAAGGHFNEIAVTYTSEDFRFTKRENTLYAICLAWPEDGWVTVKSLAADGINEKVANVELLGFQESLRWEQTSSGLQIFMPREKPCDIAWSLKIKLA